MRRDKLALIAAILVVTVSIVLDVAVIKMAKKKLPCPESVEVTRGY